MPGIRESNVEKHKEFLVWRKEPIEEREPRSLRQLAIKFGLSYGTVIDWERSIRAEEGLTAEEEIDEFFQEAKKLAYGKGNSKALEILGKAKGFITNKEKDQSKIAELSADEYYSILREARARVAGIQEQPGGMGSLSGELSVLHDKVREDTVAGEAAEDSRVGSVGILS